MQLEIWEILTRIEALQFNLILEHHYSREKVLQSMCCSPLVWRPLSRHSMGTWPILERLAKSANWEHHRLLYWYVSTATQHSGTSVDVKIWWFGLLNEYPWVTHTDSHRKGVRRNNFNSMVGLEDKSASIYWTLQIWWGQHSIISLPLHHKSMLKPTLAFLHIAPPLFSFKLSEITYTQYYCTLIIGHYFTKLHGSVMEKITSCAVTPYEII